MTSSSSQGTTSIVLTFNLNRDIDAAAQTCSGHRADPAQPAEDITPPSYQKVNPADDRSCSWR